MNTLFRAAAVAFAALSAIPSDAYEVITDQALFAEIYVNPTKLIDFSHLADGTTFRTDGYMSSPLITYISTGGPGVYYASIRESGWSNDLLIGSIQPNGAGEWSATRWYGDYITPTGSVAPAGNASYNYIYVSTGREAIPVALDTSAGFLGFIPDQ